MKNTLHLGWNKRRLSVAALFVIVTITTVFGIRVFIGISQIKSATDSTVRIANSLEFSVSDESSSLSVKSAELETIRIKLMKARSNLFPALDLISTISWAPIYGSELSDFKRKFELESEIVTASLDLLSGLEWVGDAQLVENTDARYANPTHPTERAMEEAHQSFMSAVTHFDTAISLVESSSDRSQSGLEIQVGQAADGGREVALAGLILTRHWEKLFGYGRAARYLVAAVNADELRAGGGFIPALWEIELVDGKLRVAEFIDSYEVERNIEAVPQAPIEMIMSMWAGGYFARDAAWFPEFRKTAEMLIKIFQLQGRETRYDGVIAIDQWAFQDIVGSIGPIDIGTETTLDQSNVLALLETGTDGPNGRKYLSHVMNGFIDRLSPTSFANPGTQISVLEAMSARHIQVYFTSNDINSEFEQIRSMRPITSTQPGEDYILVTDSNVGFSKVNRNVVRDLSYSVDLRDVAHPISHLSLTYSNNGRGEPNGQCDIQDSNKAGAEYSDAKVACLWNLLRIYAPPDTKIAAWPQMPMPSGALYSTVGYDDLEDSSLQYEESGLNVWSGLFTLDVGETRKFNLTFESPVVTFEDDMETIQYEGWIPHQAGIRSDEITARIHLPDDYVVTKSNIIPSLMIGNLVEFNSSSGDDLRVKFTATLNGVEIDHDYRSIMTRQDLAEDRLILAEDRVDVDIRTQPEMLGLSSVVIVPSFSVQQPGESVQYFVIARDGRGVINEQIEVDWTLDTAAVGTISQSGVLTVGSESRTHRDAIVATVKQFGSNGQIIDTQITYSTIKIDDGFSQILDQVTVYPSSLELHPGQEIPLRVLGWDGAGQLVRLDDIRLNVNIPDSGVVTPQNTFVATDSVGRYSRAVTVTGIQIIDGVSIERSIEVDIEVVEPDDSEIASVSIFPQRLRIAPGETYSFRPSAISGKGRIVEHDWLWSIDDDTFGVISREGVFTAFDSAVGSNATVSVQPIGPTGQLGLSATATIVLIRDPINMDPLRDLSVDPIIVEAGRAVDLGNQIRLQGRALPLGLTPIWILVDPEAGEISSDGVFRASSSGGTYTRAIGLTLIPESSVDVFALPTVFVDVQILGRNVVDTVTAVKIKHMPESVFAGQVVQLSATAFDVQGNQVYGASISWDVTDPRAGRISPDGVFIVGSNTGVFVGAVRARAFVP